MSTPALILARNVFLALLFAGLAIYFQRQQPPNVAAVMLCLTTIGALVLKSGRGGDGGGLGGAGAEAS